MGVGVFVKAVVVVSVVVLSACLPWYLGSAIADPYVPPAAPTEPVQEAAPDCPEAPNDAAARQYSDDLAALCRALSARLEQVRERAFWAVSELRQVQRRQDEQKAALGEAVCVSGCSDPVSPAPVDAAQEQYTERLVSAVDASGEANVTAVWYLAGLVLGGFVIYGVWQAFWIRRD